MNDNGLGLVIGNQTGGMPGAFSAGGDLFFMAGMAKEGKYSEIDAFPARRIAHVISGGDVRDNSSVEEDVILKLEREAFVDFWKEEKTVARVEHMLKTGKSLRN